jgi:chemotaxis protein MotB
LAAQQIDSSRLRAIAYADTMPIADNSTPEGKEKNRRVSILIKVSEERI